MIWAGEEAERNENFDQTEGLVDNSKKRRGEFQPPMRDIRPWQSLPERCIRSSR
jgi:hypothetical protein